MKRAILILLALLLLCGCAGEAQPTTVPVPETTEYMAPTEPSGSYAPGSEAEQVSNGALRLYSVAEEAAYAVALSGEDVLLFSGLDRTVLTLMTGENLYTVAQATLDILIHPDDPSFRITQNGITYFDATDGSIVFLDEDLNEVSRKQTPEDMAGSPILSQNRMKLYYCTANAIRVLDLETGIDRLLKEISYPSQYLEGILHNDSVLYCRVGDESGEEALFLSAETGELLYRYDGELTVCPGTEHYYARISEGILRLHLFGTTEEDTQVFTPMDSYGDVWYLDGTDGFFTCSEGMGALPVNYYDLETGVRTGAVELAGANMIWWVDASAESGYIYILAEHDELPGQVIYRWDPQRSQTGDETVYTGPRYTLENPDENGLALCRDRAYGLSQTYGVEILVGMDAVANEPWDYELEPEYQVVVLHQMMDQLEQVLAAFPEGFFTTLAEKTTGIPVKICLVRSMYGSPESGSLETANGIQFWLDTDAYVALAAGDLLGQTFYHEMFHVIETCVFGYSSAYDDWNGLNPDGFAYDYDYLTNQDRAEEAYLTAENRCFIDTYSMSYPKEDRARIMEYASMEGNGAYFDSSTMQKKLNALCTGIREAFDLEDYPQMLPWEQYLQKPLIP